MTVPNINTGFGYDTLTHRGLYQCFMPSPASRKLIPYLVYVCVKLGTNSNVMKFSSCRIIPRFYHLTTIIPVPKSRPWQGKHQTSKTRYPIHWNCIFSISYFIHRSYLYCFQKLKDLFPLLFKWDPIIKTLLYISKNNKWKYSK